MSDWSRLTLREAGVKLIDCVHKTPSAQEEGYAYVGIPQMKEGWIDFESARKISREDFVEWTKKAKPQENDVILSRRTNPGVTAIDRTRTEFALGQNLVLLRADGDRVFPPFLKWLVRTPEWWEQIEKFKNVGAVFDSLKCADVPNFSLIVPPVNVQRETCVLLEALDNKIELNRQMNETLEATARAIFKDWFVDFGPTRAKMEGRAPYLASDLWDLFPETLDESGNPAGWGMSKIGKEVAVVGGATPSTKNPIFWQNGNHNWVTPKDLSKLTSPVLLNTDRKITDVGVKKISSGMLPVGTVLLSSRAPVGYLAIAEISTAINQGFIAMVCDKRLPNLFVLFWCHNNLEHIKGISGGSTFAEISKKSFRPIPVIVPSSALLSAFEDRVRPLYRMLVSNLKENETLAQTRDLLLPRLMSGEIRLKDVEKATEAVA